MGRGWRIATIAGIDVYVHWSFLLLPLMVLFGNSGAGLLTILSAMLWIVAVFGCVVLHELGHALTARQFGVDTRDIVLLPIGGVARLNRIPERPYQELTIAVAGPAVNVVIAAGLVVVMIFTGGLAHLAQADIVGMSFLQNLFLANVALVVFNMLPAFPMDGGRVLRSVLAMFLPYVRATNIAATVGQVLAVGLIILGILPGWPKMLILLGLFVFLAGRAEAHMVARRHMLRKQTEPLPPGSIVFLPPDRSVEVAELVDEPSEPHGSDPYRSYR